MDERIRINLLIEGFLNLPSVTIKRCDEEKYRAAAKQVSEMIKIYRANMQSNGLMANKLGDQDLLVMVAFHFSLRCCEVNEENATKPFTELLDKLSNELDKAFAAK